MNKLLNENVKPFWNQLFKLYIEELTNSSASRRLLQQQNYD